MQVEHFVLEEVLPYYANSHTEASYCGGLMTRLRREARAVIGQVVGPRQATPSSLPGPARLRGSTGCCFFGVEPFGQRCVIIGPYEHHSNILPWRESGAEIVEIAEGSDGGPDLVPLKEALQGIDADLTIVSFSAASNVTGISTDIAAITKIAKAAGAKIIWDYAGGAPYLPISMTPAQGVEIDAIVVSPHKFLGGPGASGVLIVRHDAVVTCKPCRQVAAPSNSFLQPATTTVTASKRARKPERPTSSAIFVPHWPSSSSMQSDWTKSSG